MFTVILLNIMKKSNISKNGFLISISVLLTILSLTISCKKVSDVPGTNEVFIQGMSFTPGTITVTTNTTVTWTNKDGVTHTVTSNTGLFDSGSISNNGTYSHLFSTAGTFPYHCTVHPSMTASVVVQ
jgi:plastocyanin